MKNDLYTFNKNVWFVQLFKWVYGTDPTKTFQTFCPLFWSLVATLILFPLILVIKMFGKTGTTLLKSLESRKRDNLKRNIEAFIKRCSDVSMTDKEAYDIRTSKCWNKYYYDLDNETIDRIYNKYRLYEAFLEKLEREKQLSEAIRKEKVAEFKESKVFVYSAYVVSAAMFCLIIFSLYSLVAIIKFKPVDWDFILGGLWRIGLFIIIVLVLAGIWRYILVPIYNKLKCIKLPECRLCKLGLGKYIAMPFIFIGKGFLIVCDMIYLSYKQACPMIKWKDEEE
jgi:hypothetical protein